MAYRKIEVNGATFEYTIGRTHTKIKGRAVVRNKDIGSVATRWEDYPVGHVEEIVTVKPEHVRQFIASGRTR